MSSIRFSPARLRATRARLEGIWFSRSQEWAARNRGLDVTKYDFATRYLLSFAPLPAFRHLTPEEYRARVTELIREIEEEGREARDGNPVAGVERILAQNPYEPPTRKPKHSTRPLFHAQDREVRRELKAELDMFLVRYREGTEALRSAPPPNLRAAEWFPEGCYPPALPFTGSPAPRRPRRPPTRRLTFGASGIVVARGEIPVIELPVRVGPVEPQARGQPP